MRFFVPTDLRIGENIVQQAAASFVELGERCLILTGRQSAKASGALADLCAVLQEQQIEYTVYDRVCQNPTVDMCQEAGLVAMQMHAPFIVGVGGGSVLDAAKAAAVFAANPHIGEKELYAYLWARTPLPIVCIGTTAGTGSEVTPVSVLTDSAGRKRSIRDDRLYPVLSLGDARYLASVTPPFLASCAVDAAAHCIESFFAQTATPISRLFAARGAQMLSSLLQGLDTLTPAQREQLYLASIYGGYAISVTGTAFPHAMGYYLTETHHVPHGTACAVFLPAFLRHCAACDIQSADAFAAQTQCTIPDWTELLQRVTPPCDVRLTAGQIEALRPRYVQNKGLSRSPGSFTSDDAVQIMTELFAN